MRDELLDALRYQAAKVMDESSYQAVEFLVDRFEAEGAEPVHGADERLTVGGRTFELSWSLEEVPS